MYIYQREIEIGGRYKFVYEPIVNLIKSITHQIKIFKNLLIKTRLMRMN